MTRLRSPSAVKSRLRSEGQSYHQIAVGLGYANRSAAYKAVDRALQAIVEPDVHKLRELELARLVSRERGVFTGLGLGEDFVGGLGPDERLAAFIPPVDEGADGCDQVLDGGEGAAADRLPGDDPKKISTRFSQLPEVGVKCSWTRGCLASQF